jgi:putative CocE/NonD family hydrolase
MKWPTRQLVVLALLCTTMPAAAAPGPYDDYVTRSLYVPMRDGVKLAIDVDLPRALPSGVRVPTILVQTRYWRALDVTEEAGDPRALDWRHPFKLFFAQQGYAVVVADVRGTGASFGVSTRPWSPDEIADGGDLASWIVAQPWSNGNIGGWGISYEGSAAQFLAVPNHPAVKAVVPEFMEYDVYRHIAFPGGIFNQGFVAAWSAANALLDHDQPCADSEPGCDQVKRLIRGVKPVDDDVDGGQLQAAVREHDANPDIFEAARSITFRDDRSPLFGASVDDFSVHRFREPIARSGVAIFGWGSWMDAATAEAVLDRLMTLPNRQQAIIGPWNHGATTDANPYRPPDAPVEPAFAEQMRLVLRFFDFHLKGVDNGWGGDPRLIYYTLGENTWKTTDVWPLPHTRMQRLYLAGSHRLSAASPSEERARDTYTVDFEATTGDLNRWVTELGGEDVVYPDRAEADRRLLTYTSAPLERDTEITGNPVVHLFLSSTHADGGLFVYLEDVDPAGRVTYLTEGQLRAIDRKLSRRGPGYRELVPHHSFRREDARPLVPGRIAELSFGLNPISVLLKKGHCVRIAIAGQDKSMFLRIPEAGTPVLRVHRDTAHASFLELPTIRRD